ncbi:monodehydroascorbate reductase (NADH) [Galdieria sulphuraria]|uniref:Monodehydroascorbate reductase (NADH) n=1 Tax=Galdieria sulphuraria TaxID=130081 RepID=M2WT01_GALSU|nr:monodehydroascorbate reductase (NADH) [Galdieria sulphuraria]EME27020.1 monodehydroascorbate reductase (NADH) [Galdieria sulphuraria]|eukprot:XP_005703540.1 monodehydroascorbate reductase (NADH) [Galdieria sulphuraria]
MVLLWAFYTNDCLYTIHTSSIIKSWSDVLFVHSEPGKYYKYVVIGTGEAAREAVEVIRTKDPNGSLFILSDKTMEEYSRPSFQSLLSSSLVRKEERNQHSSEKEGSFFVETSQVGSNNFSDFQPTVSDRVEKLDIAHNRILLSGGEWVRYGKLLLSPADYLELPWDILVAKDCTNYVHWRIWELDKEELNKLSSGWTAKSNSLPHITIVGGGWYAVAYVCKLKQLGFPITMVFPEPSISARYLPRYLCDYISSKLKAKGVDLVSYALIRYVSKSPSSTESHLHVHISRTYDSTNIGYFDTDYLFFVPTHMSSGLLRWSADVEDILEMDVLNGGILCNAELLAASDVYVAGSAVSFPNRFIGRRREQGSEHNLLSGRVVGVNMSGGREYYRHIPMREMELSDICMPMFLFGDIDSSYDSASYFHVDHYLRQQKKIRDWNVIPIGGLSRYLDGVERGVLFFLRDNQVVGICLWNVTDSNSHQMARTLVRDAVPVSASNLRQIASQLLLCETKDEQLIEKSSLGRTTHPYQSHYGGPLNRNHNHSSLPFYSTKTSSSKHLTTSLDPKKNEILWETKDYFVSGRTQNDLKNQAFRKAILGY